MMSYQTRRAKFLVKMLKTERPGIICLNDVKITIDPSINGRVVLGFTLWDSVNFALDILYEKSFWHLGWEKQGFISIPLPETYSVARTF